MYLKTKSNYNYHQITMEACMKIGFVDAAKQPEHSNFMGTNFI